MSSAWRSVLPLWLLWSAACSRAASGDDNAFPFDIEGSSAVGRQDPPETSEPRVALGRLPPAAEKCNAGFFRTLSGNVCPATVMAIPTSVWMAQDSVCTASGTQQESTVKSVWMVISEIPSGAPRFCQPCPCPLPHLANFAESCYRKNGAVRCICKENYAGPNCERCAPGYYGNPLLIGSTCKKCDCSGNSDPNLIFEDCDEVTGQCRNCLRNTTGFKCERCAPGYYGDARIAKNCAVCNCGEAHVTV